MNFTTKRVCVCVCLFWMNLILCLFKTYVGPKNLMILYILSYKLNILKLSEFVYFKERAVHVLINEYQKMDMSVKKPSARKGNKERD